MNVSDTLKAVQVFVKYTPKAAEKPFSSITSEDLLEAMLRMEEKILLQEEELKMMLFDFHNYVNFRKKYATFTVDELREKYARANTRNIISNFVVHFQEKSNNPNLLSTELYRQRVLSQLMEWFQTNIQFFN